MTEYEVIKKLESMKKIKPDNNWVNFSKQNIVSKTFESEPTSGLKDVFIELFGIVVNRPKLALAYSFLVCLLFGTIFIFNSPYGNDLAQLASVVSGTKTERSISPEEKLLAVIQDTELKMDEIVAESKEKGETQVETKKILADASEKLKSLPDDQKARFADTVVAKVKTLEKNSNAVIMNEKEPVVQEFYQVIAENEIKELESNAKNLTDEQKVILKKAKDFFDVKKYGEALEELYKIQPASN
ncbi:MAG: hypothetical protein PHR47_04165 [Candidatus Pacebacteria bacterium]|nr:hypothetical protein [Candidatus Paceibacterota bacterium]